MDEITKFNRSLERVVSYLFYDERRNWEECGEPHDHIFCDVQVLQEYLDAAKKGEKK